MSCILRRMLSYEVTIQLDDASLADALERYMRETHLADVFATRCFIDAHFERGEVYRTRYTVESQADLDRYLDEHAPRMRADFIAHFPTGLRVTRAVWSELHALRVK
jgi:hypothetical protein